MIRSGVSASQAAKLYGYEDIPVGTWRAIWCAQRFGQSLTFLPDGRIVQVAGEHEDWYDTDFCIYNDIFVHTPDGTVTIYGYPESLFPPMDFHTATFIGKFIYLIGSLGYPKDRRHGDTPVFRLHTSTFQIEPVQTSGDKPGWINKHRAIVSAPGEIRVSGGEILSVVDGKEVQSDNAKVFLLDVERGLWRSEPTTA